MITFKKLWDTHPTITNNDNPCSTNGKRNFTNQCAIRMGVCLAKNGVDTTKIPGVRHCWHHNKSEGHIVGAEELAKGLKWYHLPGIQRVQEIAPENFEKSLRGKTGIIFFKDHWCRTINGKKELFRNRSGDHIDLWNRFRLTDWFSWVRIHMRIGNFGVHSVRNDISDYEESKAIWFWGVI